MLRLPFRQNHKTGDLGLARFGKLGFSTQFRISASTRTAHLHVIDVSGKGKSKLLEHCLYQDIVAGHGCGLIDANYLLADDLVRSLVTRGVLDDPEIRQRIIYVNSPFRLRHPLLTP